MQGEGMLQEVVAGGAREVARGLVWRRGGDGNSGDDLMVMMVVVEKNVNCI